MSDRRLAAAARLDRLAHLAFGLLVVTMPFRLNIDLLPHPTAMQAPLNDVVVYFMDFVVLATIAFWLGARLADRRPIRLGPRALVIPAAVLVVLGWVTLPTGVLPELSLFGAVRLSVQVVLALYIVNEVRRLADLAVPLGIMVAVQAVVAIGQFVTQRSVGLYGLGELRLDPSNLDLAAVLREDGVWVLRAYGLSTHPNVLGGFFAVGILLLIGVHPPSRAGRVLQIAAVGLGLGGLLVTLSRGAGIGLAVGLVAWIVIDGWRAIVADRRRWIAIGGVALAVAVIGGWQLRGELAVRTWLVPDQTSTEIGSVHERLAQIELGWRVLLERPLTGVGMTAVPVEMERLDPAFTFAYYPPHLIPLMIAAEVGIGGGLAFLVLMAAPWVLLLRIRSRWNRELAAVSGALAVLTIGALVDDYPWVGGPGRTMLWFVLGLWACVYLRSTAPAPIPGPSGSVMSAPPPHGQVISALPPPGPTAGASEIEG